MHINYFTLLNIGPHKKLEFGTKENPLPRGTVGVFGANGSGKSTALEALIASLTNKFTGIADTKELVIRDGASIKDKSSVETVFTHAQQQITLLNSIRPDKITITGVDGKELKGWDNVSTRLEGLGLSLDILNAVFLRQNAIDGLFASTSTVRARLYQKMLMLGDLAGVQKTTAEHARSKRLAITIIDQSDNINVEKARLQEQLELQKKEQQEQLLLCLTTDEYAALRDAVAAISRRETVKRELAGLTTRKETTGIKLKVAKDSLKLAPQWRAALTKTKVARDKAVKYLEEFKAHKRARQAYAEFAAKRDQLTKAEADLAKIVIVPYDEKRLSDAKVARERYRDRYRAAKAIVDTFADLEKAAVCPTCKQAITDVKKSIAAQRAVMAQAKADGEPVGKEVSELESAKIKYDAAVAGRASVEKRIATLKGSMEKSVEKPKLADAITKLEYIKTTRLRIAKRNKEVRELRAAKASYLANLPVFKELTKSIDTRGKELQEMGDVGEDRSAELAEQDHIRAKVSELKGKIDSTKKSIEQQEQKLVENARRLKENEVLDHRIHVIEETSDLFHPKRLPLRVSRACLVKLEPFINKNIRKFGGGFSCEPTDDLDLMITMPGKGTRSIRRLSIGQRVVLSICFWLAQLELFAGDIGMLVLDEPTANLDEKNRRYLGEVLKTVSRTLRNRLQMIVISHDPLLKSSFDRVIEIG